MSHATAGRYLTCAPRAGDGTAKANHERYQQPKRETVTVPSANETGALPAGARSGADIPLDPVFPYAVDR